MAFEVTNPTNNIVFFVLKPLLVDLPVIVSYCKMIASQAMSRPGIMQYRKTRLITLVLFVLICAQSMVYSWQQITKEFTIDYCNRRQDNYSRTEYDLELKSGATEYSSYEEWVHDGRTAE